MKDRTYEDQEYWNNLRRSRDRLSHEHVFTDGNDGENEFDANLKDRYLSIENENYGSISVASTSYAKKGKEKG